MEIKFKKDLIKKVLEKYYKEYEGIDGNITIATNAGYSDYRGGAECNVTIYLTTEAIILGEKIKTKKYLTIDDVRNIFDTMLQKDGYKLLNLTYDTDVIEDWNEFAPFEQCVYKPVFKGINVNIKELTKDNPEEKGKQITLGRMMTNGNIPRQR